MSWPGTTGCDPCETTLEKTLSGDTTLEETLSGDGECGTALEEALSGDGACDTTLEETLSGDGECDTSLEEKLSGDGERDAIVPMVHVCLITSLRILPHQSVITRVKSDSSSTGPLCLSHQDIVGAVPGVCVGDSLFQPGPDGEGYTLITNSTGFTQRLEEGELFGGGCACNCSGAICCRAVHCYLYID